MESITQEFTDALHGMGYPEEWVEKVLLGAAKGYARILTLEGRNRSGVSTRLQKRHKRLLGPSNWFISKEAGEKLEGEGEDRPRENRNGPKNHNRQQYTKI